MVRMKLSALFLASSMMGGCTAINTNPNTCMQHGTADLNPTRILFDVKGRSDDVFSSSCDEAKAAAMATLVGRNSDGTLHPASAYVAKGFVEGYAADLNDPAKAAYASETLGHYHTFLRDFGKGASYNVDVLNALKPKPLPDIQPVPAPAPDKSVKCGKGASIFMACTPESN